VSARRLAAAFVAGALMLSGCTFLFLGGPEVDDPGPAVSTWWEDAGPALDRA
jgi:hypothetical protein